MNKTIGLILLSATLFLAGCDRDQEQDPAPVCEQSATVRDLRGLDACGFVFELEDGTRLEPIRTFFCGTPPLSREITEDPLYSFEFVDGKRVKISYDGMTDMSTACMAGIPVKITCLTEENDNEKEL